MTTKTYLQQAYKLDQRINNKLDQLKSLNELATKCTSTLTGMPHSPNHGNSSMANTVEKIVDLQADINRDIDVLVDLKSEMVQIFRSVKDIECQLLLESRYLCYHSWEQIAVDMGYTVRNIHYLHKQALRSVVIPEK